jgi:hypothetical protein
MDKVLDERLAHNAMTQSLTPVDQRLQLIEPIDNPCPEPVECIIVVTLHRVECQEVFQRRHMPSSLVAYVLRRPRTKRGVQHDREIAALRAELLRHSQMQEVAAEARLGRVARLEAIVSALRTAEMAIGVETLRFEIGTLKAWLLIHFPARKLESRAF